MGEASYRPSCTITLQDGGIYRTPNLPDVIDIADWPLFNITHIIPQRTPINIDLSQTSQPFLTTMIAPMPSFEWPNDWFDDGPTVMGITATILSVTVPCFCSLLFFLCFWKKVKNWVNSKIQNNGKDEDFEFISVPLTPKAEKFDKLELPTTSSSPPPVFPKPVNSNFYEENELKRKDSVSSILKTPKSVHFN